MTNAENAVQNQEEVINEVQNPTETVETPAVEAVEAAPAVEAPVAEQPADSGARANTESDVMSEEAKKAAELKQKKFDEAFAKIKAAKDENKSIEVSVKDRIRGGLRVMFEDVPIFLPASHFSLKRNPTEEEMSALIGQTIQVMVHELQEDENARKTVIVSRKRILEDNFWNNIKIGDVVEGPVSSIASFGIFIDLGGIEGLIHISRLSQVHVADPKTYAKKGQTLKAIVVEVDRTKNRIALNRKDLEESPWKDASDKYPLGSRHKAVVRRLTDFGAYLELSPGVDGLLRTNEISWTKRIKTPGEVLKAGDEIEVEILSVSEEKKTLSLSLRKTQTNPWFELKDKYPVGKEIQGVVSQIMTQGVIVTIEGEVDGFMPRSKMKNVLRGKKIPYNVGDSIEALITDVQPEQESLILAPKFDESAETAQPEREERSAPRRNDNRKAQQADASSDGFSFQDLLSEKMKKKLFDQVK
eukprot:TRINITY_DN25516_c0_g1_i1.p1 TRINITY_DN25516_c0_g1~~TRINITY_DN25516_c0_g1_i1.p1  ORF type:complete len:472 (+),score=38.40 TRINITY_DN25516_c0_g1_i1:161-1576(+)